MGGKIKHKMKNHQNYVYQFNFKMKSSNVIIIKCLAFLFD